MDLTRDSANGKQTRGGADGKLAARSRHFIGRLGIADCGNAIAIENDVNEIKPVIIDHIDQLILPNRVSRIYTSSAQIEDIAFAGASICQKTNVNRSAIHHQGLIGTRIRPSRVPITRWV